MNDLQQSINRERALPHSPARWRRVLPFVVSMLMLGVLACLCGPLGNILPGGGGEAATEEIAPTEEPPAATEAPTEEPTPKPTGITADNADSVQQLREFVASQQIAFGLKIAPDGDTLAVFGFDGTIHIFDVETGTEVQTLSGGHSGPGWGMAFSPDGSLLASGGEDFRLNMWDVETGENTFNFVAQTNPQDMAFTPDGSKLVYIGPRSSRVFVIDLDGREVGQITEHGRVLGSVDVSPDGKFIASGNGRGNVVISDAETLATVIALNDGTGTLWATKFSPDGAWLATGSGSGDVWIWSTSDWSLAKTWLAHRNGVQYLAWSKDSSVLVTVGTDGRVIMWDAANGSELNTFQFTVELWKVDFAPDGSYFATLGGDRSEGRVRIFGLP